MTLGGLCPTDQKLEVVRNWKVPQNVKDVRSFLGFANYYWRYVHQFTEVAHPLTELTKKGVEWQWGPYQQQSFQELKTKLCTAPILQFPNPKVPYIVVIDASGTTVGGVLMQDQGNGLRPLACMSRCRKPHVEETTCCLRPRM